MRERKLLSTLFPAHADLQPILKTLREKYQLPDEGHPDKDLASLVLEGEEIPREALKADLETEIRAQPEMFPESIQVFRRLADEDKQALDDPQSLLESADLSEENLQAMAQAMLQLVKPMVRAYEQMVEDSTELAFYYLITGDTQDIPSDWLGKVFTMSIFGEPVVVAMASQLSNPKVIRDEFVAEIHKQFGRDRPIMTDGFLDMAKYLRQRMSGEGLAKIVDAYIDDHPDQFNKNRNGPEFRDQRETERERFKKALMRYEARLLKLLGDKN